MRTPFGLWKMGSRLRGSDGDGTGTDLQALTMAAPRPYWKGHMRLSLVSFPVALYSAISSERRIAFNQIDRKTGQRIRERKVAEGVGEEVSKEDVVKGYEYEKGRYVILEDEDFEKVRLETRKTIELIQFFGSEEMDWLYVDKPYYVAPDGRVAEEAFAVVRESMRRSGKVGLGRVVLAGRERLLAIAPRDKGFAAFALHAQDVIRKPASVFADIGEVEIDEDEVAVAEQLIGRKTAPFDPGKFVDRYQEALREIIEEKLAGIAPEAAPAAEPAKVVNLMDALKRSLAEGEGGEEKPAKGRGRKRAGT